MGRSFADIKKLKKPNELSVEIILNAELTRALSELYEKHSAEKRKDSKENRPAKAPAIQKQIDALLDRIEEEKVTFTFRDCGRQKFDTLVDACPPTPTDKAQAKEAGQGVPTWSPEKFVPALIHLTAIDPELTEEEAAEIYNTWGRGDVEALFNAALQVCLEQASIPFTRRDTDAILASVQSLITQQNEGSPTASS